MRLQIGLIPLFFCVQGLFALELTSSIGLVTYQFEGAGPSGTLWETKPSYINRPYLEIDAKFQENKALYQRIKLEYLSGAQSPENGQPLLRRIDTLYVHSGWGLRPNDGFSFEFGPSLIYQNHQIATLDQSARSSESITRLGSFFDVGYQKSFFPWLADLRSSMTILGWPRRQSAISVVQAGLRRSFEGTPWILGIRWKKGLIQLERDENQTVNLGSVNPAVLLFRQNETDTSIWALSIGYKL